jgi:hypothetical protein
MNSVDLKKRLCKTNLSFSDRINQASLKSFALAGGMDKIEKYESKINPDNPARLGIAYFTKRSRVNPV